MEKADTSKVEGLDAFLSALEAAVRFEAAEVSVRPDGTNVKILGKVPKENWKKYLDIGEAMKHVERDATGWALYFAKVYFLLGEGKDASFVWGWHIVLQGKVPVALAELRNAVKSIMVPERRRAAQLSEYPLPGASESRNNFGKGKGVRVTPGGGESAPSLEFFRR